jgi:hypothetical protein
MDRYYPGQIVRLYPPMIHEGPHPSDADQPTRYAIVVRAIAHPYNSGWVTNYDLAEYLDDERPGADSIERLNVKPGAIAGLAYDVPGRTRATLLHERRLPEPHPSDYRRIR